MTSTTRSDFKPLALTPVELVKYSPTEKKIFQILKALKGRRIATDELTEKFYDGPIPMHGRTIISGTVNSLIEKIERNDEAFRVCRSERAGPKSTWVWIERR
jgi:hypothetical protein